jgi:anaerobic dimethyl sulfoxide reductase subunit B
MSQYAFYFDGTRCTGCKTCVFACKDYNNLEVGFNYRKVYEYTGGETMVDSSGCYDSTCFSYYLSMACNHCEDPACTKVCPTGAMHKDTQTGIVSVDASKCIGCGYCHMACPYNAPKVDRTKGHSVKCDACQTLLAKGERPACVTACPARALDFGTVDEMASMASGYQLANIAPLPNKSYTGPNFFIKPCADARPAESVEGIVANPLEVQ